MQQKPYASILYALCWRSSADAAADALSLRKHYHPTAMIYVYIGFSLQNTLLFHICVYITIRNTKYTPLHSKILFSLAFTTKYKRKI